MTEELPSRDEIFYRKMESQVNPKSLLLPDYWNAFNCFQDALFAYNESVAVHDEEGTQRMSLVIMKAAKKFETYRSYLKRRVKADNKAFFEGQMSDADCDDFAEQLCIRAPKGEVLDDLCATFRGELDTIKTEEDIFRLGFIVDRYLPQARAILHQ